MVTNPDPNDAAMAEYLARLLWCRDGLDLILWAETDPLTGLDAVMRSLDRARRTLLAAGSGVKP